MEAKLENVSVIRSEEQYKSYLQRVDRLMDNDPFPDSEEGILLDTLTILLEDYERKQGWELPAPNDPVEVIRIRMNDLGMKQQDLVPAIGDKTLVSRILNRSRQLNYKMVLPLSELLGIPAELLLKKDIV